MNYLNRYITFFVLDSVIVLTAIYMGYWLLHPTLNIYSNNVIFISAITLLVAHHIVAHFYKLYSRMWSVASVRELVIIGIAVTISIVMAMVMQNIINGDIYFRVLAITWLLHIVMIGGSRFILRLLHDQRRIAKNHNMKRVLIIGAGQAGMMLARSIQQNAKQEYKVVGFIDDDLNKRKLSLMNAPVIGNVEIVKTILTQTPIDEIIIAIPSLNKMQLKALFNRLNTINVPIKIMPKIEDVIVGNVSVKDMRDIKIEDLLGRDEVQLDMLSISEKVTDKVVLVTGAGGSIGSEICRQVIKFQPRMLILLGHGENSIYTISMELQEKFVSETIILPIIADIQDRERIFKVVEQYKPQVIYHAAAHKHVPLMEINPKEAVKNNVFGTKNVAEAADAFGVENFVMVSTDKAVNPPNVMGATKRIAEMVVQDLAKRSKTNFAAVRFGNVLGSRGSVVPRFKEQIAVGGPVTVTHPDMTRYFMTIPEASRLVIQAGALAKGGEVFVLDMGDSVKIVDLAKNVIELAGYSVEEIGIKFTGIRPGEKMYEELLNPEEIQEENVYPKIHVGKANCMEQKQLQNLVDCLLKLDEPELKELVVNVANGKWTFIQ
jgi:FlaA1/EpsC-like NDP-sugar epimerase